MMINNQEESEKYLKIAQKYLLNDDHRNALQYLYKSQQSHPSTYVKDMIDKVEQLIIVSEENGRFESKRRREDEAKSKRESNCDQDDGEDDTSIRPDFSEDQLEAVQRIKECRDYYQILGTTKDASDQELKKQYRRLALQFHPDKNKAPGASDAFKAISSAFEILGDPDKRRYYDLYGTSDPNRIPKKRTDIYAENNYYPSFTGQNMSPEEIFHVFFDNAHRMYGSRNHWYSDRTSSDSSSSSSANEPSGLTVFLQIFPVIVFILMSLMSSLLIYDPVYSLTRTTRYPFIRKTSDLHVPYFVRANFERDYKHNLRKIEEDVNQEFIRDLKTRCFKEKNYRENLIWKARNIGDTTFEERARRMKTPSCAELQDLQQLIDDKI